MSIISIIRSLAEGSLTGAEAARQIYYATMEVRSPLNDAIGRALDAGTNADIRYQLCRYIWDTGYDHELCRAINRTQFV